MAKKIEIIDFWGDDERKEVRVDGEIKWTFTLITEEDVEMLTDEENIYLSRICLYGEPEVGKILLVNYEDGANIVVDSIKDIKKIIRKWERE